MLGDGALDSYGHWPTRRDARDDEFTSRGECDAASRERAQRDQARGALFLQTGDQILIG